MSATITAEIEKAVAELRPLGDAVFTVHYTNEHGVPVRRQIRISAEQVDGSVVQGAAA
jgi:hypothetical protein